MRLPVSIALAALAAFAPGVAHAGDKTLEDYRHFRAITLDLLGRMPTRDEIAAFEGASFDLDAWIDQQLERPAYVDRLTRVWMDVLRLEVGPALQFRPPSTSLRRVTILGPDGKSLYVYYRPNQRRVREATDGEFCLTKAETGLSFPPNKPNVGTAVAVKQEALDAATVLVKPWWLYRDYRSAAPVLRYGDAWKTPDVGYQPIAELLLEADEHTPTVSVRVCKEEAQGADSGTVYATGRKPQKGPPPFDRLRPLPLDDAYAKANAGKPIACRAGAAVSLSVDCGCGVGLERCYPGEGFKRDGKAFVMPSKTPLGVDLPFDQSEQSPSDWMKLWWTQEAVRFLGKVFRENRDFREVLTGRWSTVNGPLAQFYRSNAAANSGKTRAFGLVDDGEPLFDPGAVPVGLLPHDVGTWESVADRGPHAAGILTMPAFLTKYASRRARGAALYASFLCKSFVAGDVMLMPSTEPNLMKRPGCATCHATLEPLAAYFSRVVETDWRWLPEGAMPTLDPRCKLDAAGKAPGFCRDYYDPAFSSTTEGFLRGAYASPAHAAGGPALAGAELAAAPELGTCVVERVAAGFLGRALDPDDATLVATLRAAFVDGGYKIKPLVRSLLRSPQYRSANNLASKGTP